MVEPEQQELALTEPQLIFATGKELTFLRAAQILGLSHIAFFNPETPGQPTFKAEPEGEDSLESVMFKLSRALELFSQGEEGLQASEQHVFIATDVAYSVRRERDIEPEFLHKLVRRAADWHTLDEQREKQRLAELYSKESFVARWQLAIGVAENHETNLGVVTILGNFDPLTQLEIDRHFEPEANSGMQMVEIGIERGLDFRIVLADSTEPIICNTPELRELIKQLIVLKVPTLEMIEALRRADAQQHPERYRLVFFAFQDLFTNGDQVIH